MITKVFQAEGMAGAGYRMASGRRFGMLLAFLGALSVGSPPLSARAAGAELRDARLTATGTSAQLTLEVVGTTTQKIFTLDRPRRVVIDLPRTSLVRGFRAPEAAGVVAEVRTGHQLGGTLRVVVQLKSPAPARSTWMPETASGRRQLIISFGDASPDADTTPKVVVAPHAPVDGDRDVEIGRAHV